MSHAGTVEDASWSRPNWMALEKGIDEMFDGNGRTCATRHVESNNFTVDPALIATLPSSDPLFVAETNPALATLENSDLLRRFGLILVNADGFDGSATACLTVADLPHPAPGALSHLHLPPAF